MQTTPTPAASESTNAATSATQPPYPGQHWPEQGGTYIGIAPAEGSMPMRHLVVLDAKPAKHLTWQAAVNWAQDQGNGARLPTQLEALFAFTTSRAAFEPHWHWTGTQAGRYSAFAQDFEYGVSNWSVKGGERRSRAFRGLALQTFSPLTGVAVCDTVENFLATEQVAA